MMVDTDKLRGLIYERGFTMAKTALAIGMTPKTFYSKMKSGVFGTDDAEGLIALLSISNPAEIFLARR